MGSEVEISGSDSSEPRHHGKIWIISLVLSISLTRIGHGFFMSLSGPTLLYLADNVHASVGQVSSMFTGRSAGFFFGTVIFGLIKKRYPAYKPLTTVAIGIIIAGMFMAVIPWITTLALLVVDTTVTGIMLGYFDAGLQALYLQLWGEKESRPYIQSFHFFFGVGAFLAPIIAAPFLELADQENSAGETCSNVVNDVTTVGYNTTSLATSSPPYTGINPVSWTYIIAGAFTFAVGVFMLVIAIFRVEDRVKTNHKNTAEQRLEEPIRDVIGVFLPVFIYYFMCASIETVYQSYVYSIAVCSELSFSVSDASTVNTVFWVGFVVGRGSGISYAKFFKPRTIIIADLIGVTLALLILSIFGRYVDLIIWAVSVFSGLSVATLYPTGVSWTSLITNVSATYILVFGAGNTVGVMTMTPLGGALFEMDPFNVVYLILAMCICNILAYIWMEFAGRKHLNKLKNAETKLKLESFCGDEEFKTKF